MEEMNEDFVKGFCVTISEDENGELELVKDPDVQFISKKEIMSYYKFLMRSKPKQLPIGQFQSVHCNACDFDGVVHIKQTFCPLCHHIVEKYENYDPNEHFEEKLERWVEHKNFMERMFNNDILKLVEDINSEYTELSDQDVLDDMIGKEIVIDE